MDMILIRLDIEILALFLFFWYFLHLRDFFFHAMHFIHHGCLRARLPVSFYRLHCMLIRMGFCFIPNLCFCHGGKTFPVRKADQFIQKAADFPALIFIQGMRERDVPHS